MCRIIGYKSLIIKMCYEFQSLYDQTNSVMGISFFRLGYGNVKTI